MIDNVFCGSDLTVLSDANGCSRHGFIANDYGEPSELHFNTVSLPTPEADNPDNKMIYLDLQSQIQEARGLGLNLGLHSQVLEPVSCRVWTVDL